MLRVTCPSCSANIHILDQLAGKTIRCKQCQQIFTVGALPKDPEPRTAESRRPAPPAPEVPVVRPIAKAADQRPDPLREGLQSRPARVPPASELANLAPLPRSQPPSVRRRPASRISHAWLIGGGAAGALLLIGLGVALVLVHPPEQDYAAACYRLGKQASVFRAEVALSDTSTPLSAAVFEVWGDGKRLWKSKAINQPLYSQRCRVDVSKVDVLELRVSSTGSPLGLHAVWYEPRLLEKPNTPDK